MVYIELITLSYNKGKTSTPVRLRPLVALNFNGHSNCKEKSE